MVWVARNHKLYRVPPPEYIRSLSAFEEFKHQPNHTLPEGSNLSARPAHGGVQFHDTMSQNGPTEIAREQEAQEMSQPNATHAPVGNLPDTGRSPDVHASPVPPVPTSNRSQPDQEPEVPSISSSTPTHERSSPANEAVIPAHEVPLPETLKMKAFTCFMKIKCIAMKVI